MSMFFLGIGVFLFVKCEAPRTKTLLIASESPFQILHDTIIKSDIDVEPGVVIELADSITVTFLGDVTMRGSRNNKIAIRPINSSWEYLKFEGPESSHHFEHVNINNGKLLFDSKSRVELFNVEFNNTAIQDQKYGLLVMSSGGSFDGDSIRMISNNTGEGIVVCGLDSMNIKNSYFENVNDAVELMVSENGLIMNCTFNQSLHDDGVDLDGCENVHIIGNSFYGIADNCIEVGLDNYSSAFTLDVIIENNRFFDSRTGVLSKDYSEIKYINNSFSNCENDIEISDTAFVVF